MAKLYSVQLLIINMFVGWSLHSSSDEHTRERSLHLCSMSLKDEKFSPLSRISTPALSSSNATPNSAKKYKSTLFLSLSPFDLGLKVEQDSEMLALERKIVEFHVTRASASWLGKKVLKFKIHNPDKHIAAISLIEKLHNRVAMPLREFFKDEDGDFDKDSYNEFLEHCLPRLCQDSLSPLKKISDINNSFRRARTGSIFEEREA